MDKPFSSHDVAPAHQVPVFKRHDLRLACRAVASGCSRSRSPTAVNTCCRTSGLVLSKYWRTTPCRSTSAIFSLWMKSPSSAG